MFFFKYLVFFFSIYFSDKIVDDQYNQAPIDQLEQKPEVKNKLIQTPISSSDNSNLFSYIFRYIQNFFKGMIYLLMNFIFNPIKNIFIGSNIFKKTKIGKVLHKNTLNTGETLICRKSKISKENNAEGLEIDFGILDLKFGADIIDINQIKDEAEKLKTLLDFTMTSIDKNDIDEFRLIIDLNDQKIFLRPFSFNITNRRQSHSSEASLTQKFKNLLAGGKSTLEFLYHINCDAKTTSTENTIYMGGCWSRGRQAFKMLIMAFDDEAKNNPSNPKFKKDIMEMWFNWNDAQKYNFSYGVQRALYDMGLKKCPGLYLKYNRGIKNGNQSQELNHLHVIVEEKEDLKKMSPSLYENANKFKKNHLVRKLSLDESIFLSGDQ